MMLDVDVPRVYSHVYICFYPRWSHRSRRSFLDVSAALLANFSSVLAEECKLLGSSYFGEITKKKQETKKICVNVRRKLVFSFDPHEPWPKEPNSTAYTRSADGAAGRQFPEWRPVLNNRPCDFYPPPQQKKRRWEMTDSVGKKLLLCAYKIKYIRCCHTHATWV